MFWHVLTFFDAWKYRCAQVLHCQGCGGCLDRPEVWEDFGVAKNRKSKPTKAYNGISQSESAWVRAWVRVCQSESLSHHIIRSSCLIYVQSVVNPFSFASCRSCSEWILEPDVNPQGSTMSTQSTLALSSGCLGKQLRSSKGDDRDLCNFRLQILQPPTIPTIHLSDFSLLLHWNPLEAYNSNPSQDWCQLLPANFVHFFMAWNWLVGLRVPCIVEWCMEAHWVMCIALTCCDMLWPLYVWLSSAMK